MGTTPQGIVYPDPSGQPRRQDLQVLAESVDAAITPDVETVSSLGLTVHSDWTVSFFAAAAIGVQRMIQARLIYNGVATITGGTGGGMLDISVLTGLPVDWRPASSAVFIYSRGVGGVHGSGYISSDGRIALATLAEDGTIATGNAVGLNIAYLGSL